MFHKHIFSFPSYAESVTKIDFIFFHMLYFLPYILSESTELNAVLPAGNFSAGLAWSHYLGFLEFNLPGKYSRFFYLSKP